MKNIVKKETFIWWSPNHIKQCQKRVYEHHVNVAANSEKNISRREKFWKTIMDQRKQFIAREEKIRTRSRNDGQANRRKFSWKYILVKNSREKINVCKIVCLNTYTISEKTVRNCLKS